MPYMHACAWLGCLSNFEPKATVETSSTGRKRQVTALFRVDLGQFLIVFCYSTCDNIQ